jgi:ElaB/YqjD/DUF883 family membrane-anchored ribosome-binding protein
MAETLHQSSDVPNFDTYGSREPKQLPANSTPSGPALVQRAQQIGAALGRAVSNLRNAKERLQELGSETNEAAATHLSDLVETAKVKAHELGQAAATRASEVGAAVAEKAGQLGEQAKAGYFRARRRANQVSRDYPLHVVVAAGAVGLLVGIGMRIWRANRAY